jgi:hypothetical protein
MIRFTEYVLPDGRQRDAYVERPAEIEALASEVVAAGGRFEIEMLRTGYVSMEVVGGDDGDPFNVAIEICGNAQCVIGDAVDRLVRDAHACIIDGVLCEPQEGEDNAERIGETLRG